MPKKEHLREVMLHYFLMKKSAAETARILGGVYGDHAPSEKSANVGLNGFEVVILM